MAAFVAFVLLNVGLACATQFGYSPGENITSNDDMVQHARDKVTKLANNFSRLAANAKGEATGLLQKLTIVSTDPEGLLALVTEDKMAINNTTPAGLDISSCESANDAKYSAMLQGAGPGVAACLQKLSDALSGYFQSLEAMKAVAKDRMGVADGNITDCVDNNQNDADGLAVCLNVVGEQVYEGRDRLMAEILGARADYESSVAAKVGAFTQCTNDVQDVAINQSVEIIRSTRECVKKLH